MNKIILSFALLLSIVTSHGGGHNLPIVSQFKVTEEKVYTHLTSIFHSVMNMAIEGKHMSELSNDDSNSEQSKQMMSTVITKYLNLDVADVDEQLVDSNPDHFVSRVVELFEQSCMSDMSTTKINLDLGEPDFEEIERKLKFIMAGYYLASFKEAKFNTSEFEMNWKFHEIQVELNQKIRKFMEELAAKMKSIQMSLQTRYTEFKKLFNVTQSEIHVVFRSFRVIAFELLLNQIRTFYLDLAVNPSSAKTEEITKNPLSVFQRTIDMWTITYKLCEHECKKESYDQLQNSLLEELINLRITYNKSIVSDKIVNTFYSKFLSYLYQSNFEQNMSGDEDGDSLVERYSMFVYRLFLSKGNRYLNEKTSLFMKEMYAEHGLDFMHPMEGEEQTLKEYKSKMNMLYVFDLILHLDYFKVNENENLDSQRKQHVSFKCTDVTDLVHKSATIFSFDLDNLNSEQLLINWFTFLKLDGDNKGNFKDYELTYKYMLNFRTEYQTERNSAPGPAFDAWMDKLIGGTIVLRDENKDFDFSDKYLLMKLINSISVMYGFEHNVTFNKDISEEKKENVINYFKRITQREEFKILKNNLLMIYFYYNHDDNGEISPTVLEDDIFVNEMYLQLIECVKLPEILNIDIKMSSIAIVDEAKEIKKNHPELSSKSNNDEEIISEEIVSETSKDVSNKSKNEHSVRSQSHNTTDSEILSESVIEEDITSEETSNKSNNILPINPEKTSSRTPSQKTSNLTEEVISEVVSENNDRLQKKSEKGTLPANKSEKSIKSHKSSTKQVDEDEEIVSEDVTSSDNESEKSLKKKDNGREIIQEVSVRSSEEIVSEDIESSQQTNNKSEPSLKKYDNPRNIIPNKSVRSNEEIVSEDIESSHTNKNNDVPKIVINEPSNKSENRSEDNKTEKVIDNDSEVSYTTASQKLTPKKESNKTWVEPSSSQQTEEIVSEEVSENSTKDINKKKIENKKSEITDVKSSEVTSENNEDNSSTNNGVIINEDQQSPKNINENSSNNQESEEYSETSIIESEETSNKTESNPIGKFDDENQGKKNLVYEVVGKLTTEQRRTLEYSNDVFADVKNSQVVVDEFGNEIEYIYVQIVRKDSDCYEELMKYK